MPKLLPSSTEEAFESFKDAPDDCHNHCDCYWQGDDCCECGENLNEEEEKQPEIPVQEFFEQRADKEEQRIPFWERGWGTESE